MLRRVLVLALIVSAVPSVAFVQTPTNANPLRLGMVPSQAGRRAECFSRAHTTPAAGATMGTGLVRRFCAAAAAASIWCGGVVPRASAEPWSLQAEPPAAARGWDPWAEEAEDFGGQPQSPQQRWREPPARPVREQFGDHVDRARGSWDDFRSDIRAPELPSAPQLPRWAGELGEVAVKIAGIGAAGGAGVFVYQKVDQWRTERVRRGLRDATGIKRDGRFLDDEGYWRAPDAPVVPGTYRGPAPPPLTAKYKFQEKKKRSPEELAKFLTVEINTDSRAKGNTDDVSDTTLPAPAEVKDIAELDLDPLQKVCPKQHAGARVLPAMRPCIFADTL